MALPSSGQITFNDVRTEMSQSSKTNYSFEEWASGAWSATIGNSYYTPINLESSGSIFTESNPLDIYGGVSMSQWYNYNRSKSVALSTTTSLYPHVSDYCYPSSMIIIDAGTTSTTLSLNISGSAIYPYAGYWYAFYGKPWQVGGGGTGSATIITGSSTAFDVNWSFNYNYTYDANKGQYLYFVLYQDNCFAP
jgi:hypothetical protein